MKRDDGAATDVPRPESRLHQGSQIVREHLRKLRNGIVHLERRAVAKFVLSDIPLAHVYTGGYNGDRQFDFANTPPDAWHPNYSLKDSPHVAFLRRFKDEPTVDPEAFKTTEYFRFGCKDIRIYGHFFGISDHDRLVRRASDFLELYRAVKSGSFGRDFVFFPGDGYLRDSFLKVATILPLNNYLIRGGHHRFAIYCVLGRTTVKARVIGNAKISQEDIRLKWEIYDRSIRSALEP
ncbi:MAG: hypothetical protein ABL986_15425 [Vicinamibacterales bacterium]